MRHECIIEATRKTEGDEGCPRNLRFVDVVLRTVSTPLQRHGKSEVARVTCPGASDRS